MAVLRKIRIGTDITLGITVMASGHAVDWNSQDIKHVYAFSDVQGQPVAEMSYEQRGSTLRCVFHAEDQNYVGAYRVIIEFNDGSAFSSTLDMPAFEIVRTSEEADIDTGEIVLDINGSMRFYSLAEVISKLEGLHTEVKAAASAAREASGNANAAATKANAAATKANDAAALANSNASKAEASNKVINDNERKRIARETARESAEADRQRAELERQKGDESIAIKEAVRARNEEVRETNEQTRKDNELERRNAESARNRAETQRATSETKRISNETSRQAAENKRVAAETSRQEAETSRVNVESERVTEFARLKKESEEATKAASAVSDVVAEHTIAIDELKSEIGRWDIDLKNMPGNYTITELISTFSLKNGDSLLISIENYTGGSSWLQVYNLDTSANIKSYPLPSSGNELEYVADADYSNLALRINVESNNTAIKAIIRKKAKSISVIDSLESSSTDNALSAAKGKELLEYIPIAFDFGTGSASVTLDDATATFKVTVIKDSNIRWIRNGVENTVTISKKTEYQISPNHALCVDTRDASIVTISRDELRSHHLPLIIAPEYDNDWNDNLQGYFIGKKQVLDDSQQGRERKRINAQRNLGNVIVSHFGSGFINDWGYDPSGQIKMTMATRSIISYSLDSGEKKAIAIDAGKTFLIPGNYALVIDSTDNEIKTKPIAQVTLGDLILAQTGEIDENFKRYITGFFADRILIESSYENYDTHNVKQIYVRDVDSASIGALQNTYDFSMIISTDLHINSQGKVFDAPTLNVVERIRKNITPNAVVNLGDSVALGLSDSSRAYYSLNDLKQPMEEFDNLFLVVGNHDYNNISELSVDRQPKGSIIPKKTIYNLLGKFHKDDCVWGSKEGMYYYKDFKEAKIRMVFLNTLDKPEEWVTIDGVEYEKYPWLPNIVSAEQVDWLIDTALNFTDKNDRAEWAVIICSHVTPAPNVPGNSASIGALQNENQQGIVISKVVEAFIAGTSEALSYTDNQYGGSATINRNADFTSQGAMQLIGWFAGHTHHDYKVTINGVTYITTLCGYYSSGVDENYISMQKDTYSEFAVDLLMVDKSARKAIVKRYGAGEDREWTW